MAAPVEKETPEADALPKTKADTVYAELEQHIMRLKNPHEQHNLKQCIYSIYNMLERPNPEERFYSIYAKYEKDAKAKPYSDAEALKLVAMQSFAALYGIEMSNEQIQFAHDRQAYIDQQAALAKEHAYDRKANFDLIRADILDYDKNAVINKMVGLNATDAAQIGKDVLSALYFINNALGKFDADVHTAIPYFDKLVEAQVESFHHVRNDIVYEQNKALLNEWRDHIKYDVLGVVKQDDFKAALKTGIEAMIVPSRQGRPDAPRVDGRKVRNMELGLGILAEKYQERHDPGLFLTHSEWYRDTNNDAGARQLANRTIESICAALKIEPPELKTNFSYVPSKGGGRCFGGD